jgi:hypothetical protein
MEYCSTKSIEYATASLGQFKNIAIKAAEENLDGHIEATAIIAALRSITMSVLGTIALEDEKKLFILLNDHAEWVDGTIARMAEDLGDDIPSLEDYVAKPEVPDCLS